MSSIAKCRVAIVGIDVDGIFKGKGRHSENFSKVGGNTGNLLFTQAVINHLDAQNGDSRI